MNRKLLDNLLEYLLDKNSDNLLDKDLGNLLNYLDDLILKY